MKIALIGYGKMGKAIEAIAIEKGHEIITRIDVDTAHKFTKQELEKADVAIEFTSPHSAFDNVMKCLSFNVPLVCGSTGWLPNLPEAEAYCKANNGSFLYASNFSIGVNIFFEINKRLAALMAPHDAYEISMEEIHHTQKKDAPSGTAVSLAKQIVERVPRKNNWVCDVPAAQNEIGITAKRIDPAPGTHTVTYHSSIDTIDIIHTAHNRTGFATGAVLAAEYIKDKKGLFSMKDVLGL